MSTVNARSVAAPLAARETEGVHSPRWYLYVAAVLVFAAAFSLLLVYLQLNWDVLPPFSPLGVLFFLSLGILAHRFRLHIGSGTWVSASFLADFLAATILGPLAGAVVAAGDIASSYQRGMRARAAFDCAAWTIVGGATGIVFWGTLHWLNTDLTVSADGLPLSETGISLLVAGVLAGGSYQALNYALYAPLMWLRRGVGARDWFEDGFLPYLPFHFFFLFLSLGLVYAFADLGTTGFVFLFLPVLGLIYAFRAYSRQRELANSERELATRLERFSLQMAMSMLTALDLKDNYTAQHSATVARYSYDVARSMGLSGRECNLARLAGLLHDLGKISVPDEVLNKRETLEQEDWDLIQGHSKAGQSILWPDAWARRTASPGASESMTSVSRMSEFEKLGQVVLHHHEHYDGMGYPYGLRGDEIPLLSRIVSVSDAYSAMTSSRPYRSRRHPEVAMAELDRRKGTQFDPEVVDSFIAVLEAETEEYRNGEHTDWFEDEFQEVRILRDIA